MLVLTWFGTIVRAETATKMLIHAPLWPSEDGAGDIQVHAPADGLTEPTDVAGMPGVTMEPGAVPGTVHFRRGDRLLRTDPMRPALSFVDADLPEGRDSFLLLEPAEAGGLRVILSHAWTLQPIGARLRPAALRVAEGFGLLLGDLRVDLTSHRPRPDTASKTIILQEGSGDTPAILLERAPAAEDQTPIVLRNGRRSPRVPEVPSAEAFRIIRDRRLLLTGNPEYVAPPLTVCDTDSDWVFMRHAGGEDMPLGRQVLTTTVHRESGKLVLLTTDAAGLVLDAQGAARTSFRVDDVGTELPPWMPRNGDALYMDRAAYDGAPNLQGSYMVVGHTALQDKGRGRIETLLALDILGRHAPANAKLLLPASLPPAQAAEAAAIPGLLRLLGLSALPAVMLDRPLCRVEEAIWLEGASVEQMPAKLLREFRAGLPAQKRKKGRRMLLRQQETGEFENEAMMADFAKTRELETVDVYGMTPEAQIALFAEAELLVASHGPVLANLLFAQAGTKVLEIAPDESFRPYYWRLAGKLGLAYAVLPTPTTGRGLDGALRVSAERLRSLYRMLNSRL
jgi:hypothetical protein